MSTSLKSILTHALEQDTDLQSLLQKTYVHPIGFVKVVLKKYPDGSCVRLHIWTPHGETLPITPHSHAWDFTSHILAGQMQNTIYRSEQGAQCFEKYIMDASKADGVYHLSKSSDRDGLAVGKVQILKPGEMYHQNASVLHSSFVSEFTVTLVHQSARKCDVNTIYKPVGFRVESEHCAHPTAKELHMILSKVLNVVPKHIFDLSLDELFWTDDAFPFTEIDHVYHGTYSRERRVNVQSHIVYNVLGCKDSRACDSLPEVVFLAGAIGCGKTSAVSNMLDKSKYVNVDPDVFKTFLPEHDQLVSQNPLTASTHMQKEAVLIAELVFWTALKQKRNIIFDSTLKDHEWFAQFFKRIRAFDDDYKLRIIHVHVDKLETLYLRAERRAATTRRYIPKPVIEDSFVRVPVSMKHLAGIVDRFETIDNSLPRS